MAKITEYPEASSFDQGDVILKDGVNGTKKMTVDNLMQNLVPPVDATLTQQGKPADAKAAGDKIADLKSAIDHLLVCGNESDFSYYGHWFVNYETGGNSGSTGWTCETIKNNNYRLIEATAVSANDANAAIVAFYNDDVTINSTTYMGSAYAVKAVNGTNTYSAYVPTGCKAIAVCTREATFENVVITLYSNDTIADLREDTDNNTNSLNAITIGTKAITDNIYYTPTTDTVIRATAPLVQETVSGYSSVKIACVAGDTFGIVGYGGALPLLMFVDSEGTVLQNSLTDSSIPNSSYTPLKVTAPATTAWLCCNNNDSQAVLSVTKNMPIYSTARNILWETKSGIGLLEIGGVNASTGAFVVAANRVRTMGYIPNNYYIEVNSGYRIILIAGYNNDGTFDRVIAQYTSTAVTSASVSNGGKKSIVVFSQTNADNTVRADEDIVKTFYGTDTGTVTPEEVADAVETYLTEHPSAITSVGVTPEMFGAVGDGETDDSEAIQDAIDYANTNGIGIVQFGDHTYICEGLIPKNDVTLKGTYVTKLRLPDSPATHMFVYANDNTLNNFNVIGINFYGGADPQNVSDYDIFHVTHATQTLSYIWDKSVIESCNFRYANVGIYCDIPGDLKIVNSLFLYNDTGLEQTIEHYYLTNVKLWGNRIGANIHQANHFTWASTTFAHNTEYGVYAEVGANQSGLIGCNFIDNPICFYGDTHCFRFVGCRFVSAGKGIVGLRTTNIVDGCYFGALTDTAITITSADTANNIVSNCTFAENKEDIKVAGTDQAVEGNTFVSTKRIPIELSVTAANGHSGGIKITGNIMVNFSAEANDTYSGITITDPYLTAIMISGNLMRNNSSGKGKYAINMDATFTGMQDVLITNNISRNMKTSGYRLSSNANIIKANNLGTIETF